MALELDAEASLGELRLELCLRVADRECLALAGPSGAGKTSALRIVAGLLRPTRGRVGCGDELWLDTARGVELPPERRRCGYLFQDYALFPHLSGWQNVAYGLTGLPRAARRARAYELLDRFGVSALADRRPRAYSGGERQRVALARALARRPRALLLDEPLSALDPRTRGGAGRALAAAVRDVGVPTILVTHDFEEAALHGDRIAVIDAGHLLQVGAPSELAAAPASAFVADFTGAVVLTGVARPGRAGLTTVELDGGGVLASIDRASGPVAASVYPWEVSIEPEGAEATGSSHNRLRASVSSMTTVGNRVRLGLDAGQPIAAEITADSVRRLGLGVGSPVVVSWKAAATRLVPR